MPRGGVGLNLLLENRQLADPLAQFCHFFGSVSDWCWHSPVTHPQFPVHFKLENPAFYDTLEFAWDPCFRANSFGVFHPGALWGRSSL